MPIDPEALRANWEHVVAHGGQVVAKRFYSYLFFTHPEVRPMFPLRMDTQRDRLVAALGGQIVANVADPEAMVPYLQQLGRDHRKFGALPEHYPAIGNALIYTLRHFSPEWTDELEAAWGEAFQLVSAVMIEAAEEAAQTAPAFWDGKITDVVRLTPTMDVAVITVETSSPISYIAGQSVPVEHERLPRIWRWYSPANPPGASTLEFHVSVVPGAGLSTALVCSSQVGDRVKIGPPFGERLSLERTESVERPLLLLAGGTGWAPMKALIRANAVADQPCRMHLILGVRNQHQLYDRAAIAELEHDYDWFTSTITVSGTDAEWPGTRGAVHEVVIRDDWSAYEVFVCGPPAMVDATVDTLATAGVPPDHIHYETLSS